MIGIYCIENIENNKRYIGQSKNIKKRIRSHFYNLRKNNSHNALMQKDYNTFGEDAFIYYIIEQCDISNLDYKEIYYINKFDTINNGYNVFLGGNGHTKYEKFFVEEREKIIKSFYDSGFVVYSNNNDNQIINKTKQVVCLNTGEIFDSVGAANTAYPSSDKSIIHKCCKNIYKNGNHTSGKINNEKIYWCYFGDYYYFKNMNFEQIKLHFNNLSICGKKIICANTFEIFNSLQMAAEYFGVSIQTIEDNLKDRIHLVKGKYVFLYL